MSYPIDTTLLVEGDAIAKGLQTGEYIRRGGVIREAASGRIRKHLLEAPGAPEQLVRAPLGAPIGPDPSALSSVLRLSQIAAAASVLNVGISLVGFAWMGRKLNKLQKSVEAMHRAMQEGFQRIEGRLDQLDARLDAVVAQLEYVTWLGESHAAALSQLKEATGEVHRLMLLQNVAALAAHLEELTRFPDRDLVDAIRAASVARRTLGDQAARLPPDTAPGVMLLADVAVRGWAVATATEAQLLTRVGHHRDARQLIEDELSAFARTATSWAEVLLAFETPSPALRTAFRYETPRFRDHVLRERTDRIAQIHASDRAMDDVERDRARVDAEVALQMLDNRHLGDEWTKRQLAIAEYADGLSELTSRIESVGHFAAECEARGVQSSTALLPPRDAKGAFYLLEAKT